MARDTFCVELVHKHLASGLDEAWPSTYFSLTSAAVIHCFAHDEAAALAMGNVAGQSGATGGEQRLCVGLVRCRIDSMPGWVALEQRAGCEYRCERTPPPAHRKRPASPERRPGGAVEVLKRRVTNSLFMSTFPSLFNEFLVGISKV
jgi:hypothetical protein